MVKLKMLINLLPIKINYKLPTDVLVIDMLIFKKMSVDFFFFFNLKELIKFNIFARFLTPKKSHPEKVQERTVEHQVKTSHI